MIQQRKKRLSIDRFMEKVNKTESCWLWTGGTYIKGYGNFWDGSRQISSHRFSYKYFIEDIPKGMCICHKCDNVACVNPTHLWLGTQKQNLQDMYSKKRNRPLNTYTSGSKHFNAKLSNIDVKTIRDVYTTGRFSHRELARKFHVSKTIITNILNNKTYKDDK